MEYLFHPATIITLSMIVGAGSRLLKWPRLIALFLPALVIFCLMSYAEFFLPYKGGGASFYPIGEIIASFYAFASGGCAYFLTGFLMKLM